MQDHPLKTKNEYPKKKRGGDSFVTGADGIVRLLPQCVNADRETTLLGGSLKRRNKYSEHRSSQSDGHQGVNICT